MTALPNPPPQPVHDALTARGIALSGAVWTPLSGGRTNRLWRLDRPEAPPVVVKLYADPAPNPLFPNDPAQERRMLQHLKNQDIAPRLVAHADTGIGPLLVYSHLDGAPWFGRAHLAARALHRLHGIAPPPDMRHAPDGSEELSSQTRAILSGCASQAARAALGLMPTGQVPPSGRRALLHGDPVPGNMIVGRVRLRLIDWQCPAQGDPCEDLALFLSPAMQIAYRGAALSRAEHAAFLASYPCPDTVARYRALAPWYHWRMLAYCLWRRERGDAAAGPAARSEEAALARLRD